MKFAAARKCLAGCETARKKLAGCEAARKHLAAIFADFFGAQSARKHLAKIWLKKKPTLRRSDRKVKRGVDVMGIFFLLIFCTKVQKKLYSEGKGGAIYLICPPPFFPKFSKNSFFFAGRAQKARKIFEITGVFSIY